jgi:hypothetical protein
MMRNQLRRLEQLEEMQFRRTLEILDRYLEGRSLEDREYFCTHGYLPEEPLAGTSYETSPMSWKEHWMLCKEHRRIAASKSYGERGFFCMHGHWPTKVVGGSE